MKRTTNLRILIVAEHASLSFGGEALLPFHYFRVLRSRGIETWLTCHERVADELRAALPNEQHRFVFVPDTPWQKALWTKFGNTASRFALQAVEATSHMMTQVEQRKLVKQIVRDHAIDVVHEPIPVSPVTPSAIFDVGAPVIIGPMNGGLDFPEGFAHADGMIDRVGFRSARMIASAANRALPGKRKASLLLVANERTRRALPTSVAHVPTLELVENGVDLSRFVDHGRPAREPGGPARFAFVGRLVDWKAVDLLIEALAQVAKTHDATLDVFGDGTEQPGLRTLAAQLGISERVHFRGYIAQAELAGELAKLDTLVLPSLRECGGAVVLEAMALGMPVIATDWGGPADYIDPSCGVLIEPRNRQFMIEALTASMSSFARSPELGQRLGAAGRAKVLEGYDWERKVDRMIELYEQVAVR